ncbi:MAG: B-box zinc finger protein [Chloroflexota bacterium]
MSANPPAAEEPSAAPRCATHPGIETYLRCNRCDTPICPRCLIQTPVGARCRGCARLRAVPPYDPKAIHLLRGFGAALGTTAALSALAPLLPFGGFLAFVVAAGVGYAASEVALRAASRKRGRWMIAAVGLGIALGFMLGPAFLAIAYSRILGAPLTIVVLTRLALGPAQMLSLVIGVFVAWYRLR